MKLLLTVLFLIYSIHSFSQKKEFPKAIISDSDFIPDEEDSTAFRSLLKHKDSLLLHHSDTLNSSIFNQVNKLDEVFIKPKSEFNAVSLGIIKEEIKPLSIYERRLYTAGDFKPIHLLSILGGSLAVDPIINAITGRTKRLKKYIQFEKKEKILNYLEDHFLDYMIKNLNIDQQIRGRFLTYLIEDERLQDMIDRKDSGELYFFIGDEWFKFKSLQNDSPVKISQVVPID